MFRFIFTLGILNIFAWNALASEKYCFKKNITKPVVINIFGQSYQNKEDQRSFLNGLNKLLKNLKVGDKIRIVTHDNEKAKISIDQCLPGCPKKAFLDKLIDTECSDQVAKKDMLIFKKKYTRIIKSEIAKSGKQYNVIDHLTSLDDYYRGRDLSKQTTYVFHSLLPYDVNPNEKKSYDKNFVTSTQNKNLTDLSIPNVTFVNPNQSKNTLLFWKDLELNGRDEGLKIDFKKIIID